MGLFDVHAHLTDNRLAAREAEVLAAARSAGVTTIISNGLNPSDNAAVLELQSRAPDLVKAAFGLYPVDAVLPEMLAMGETYVRDAEPVPSSEAVAWVRDHLDDAVAVGEIGLDHYWVPEALWAQQELVFRDLVSLAMEADKPVIVHTRKAEQRAMEILIEMGAPKVNWHCYSSKVKLGLRIGNLEGHYLSIPANARRAQNFTMLLQKLPRNKVLLETDCPYLGPDKDVVNEPKNVAGTADYASELWGCGVGEVQAQLEENFERLFGFIP